MKARMILVAAASVLIAMPMSAQNLSGRDIMQKAKDLPDGDTRYAEMELTLISFLLS